jgi:hypothetical protein
MAWRYEPLNLTTGDLNISRGTNLRTRDTDRAPYARYRFATIGDAVNPGGCDPIPDVNLRLPVASCPGLARGRRIP